jgi:hypothetical protein
MNDSHDILGPSTSPDTSVLTEALAKAQAEYKHVELDSANPHFRSKFSSYATCCDSLRGPLNKNGIALPDFRPGLVGGQWVVVGTLRHKSGQYITGMAPLVNPKGDMQGFSAAMTYAKRTLLMALTGGFSGESDDDGDSLRSDASQQRSQQRAGADVAKDVRNLQLEQKWKTDIANAVDRRHAGKLMAEVELRLREKAIDRGVYDRCKAEFIKCWDTKEVVANG